MSDSLRHTESVDSICSVLSCDSNEFWDFYDGQYSTDLLSDDAQKIINHNREHLRTADKRYRLDFLLSAMLEHAPHSGGRRYVAVTLHIAKNQGGNAVVDVAKAWLDHLLLPMLTISRATKTEPMSNQSPTLDATAGRIESASRADQRDLRAKVASREMYLCAITKTVDVDHLAKLAEQGQELEVSDSPQSAMEAAHIIPFSLNKFKSTGPTMSREIKDKAHTWDMLQSWTRIDLNTLLGPKVNSPSNAIYMTLAEHKSFRHFRFYLDKDFYPDAPNKYRVQMARGYFRLSNGRSSGDVEFPTLEQSGVEPPNLEFLRVHAAFARVLHLSAAAEYVDSVERDAERNGGLCSNGETDLGLLLMSRLAIMASTITPDGKGFTVDLPYVVGEYIQ